MGNDFTIRPLDDRIVVRLISPAKPDNSILVVPESARPNHSGRGAVISVGPGRRDKQGRRIPVDVGVGDIVQFGAHALDFREGDLAMIREGDILVVEGRSG